MNLLYGNYHQLLTDPRSGINANDDTNASKLLQSPISETEKTHKTY